MHLTYIDITNLLSLKKFPLEKKINLIAKRLFDIIFSSVIIFFILSWLVPILGILIILESKGPIFFKQTRNGYKNKEFYCYKFRSMVPNNSADIDQVKKNDMRVTKIGRFIRKTSIDELPQFFNVLAGEMSVVGPRPHMVNHTNIYAKKVHKFMARHLVKPGITGLAQIKGYRGEIETKEDIINRTKLDLFYIEKWSLIFDFFIVLRTIINLLKGEDKAY